MYTNPFEISGNWYKGNCHTHSTVSDGRLPIEDRFAAYRDAEYDFLVITDHGSVSDVAKLSEDGFLAISGSELHPKNSYGGDTYHIVALNIHEPIDCGPLHPNEVIERVKELGGESFLAHPYWSGHTILDLSPLNGYIGVEVYNDTCTGIGKGFSEPHWDNLLDKAGPTLGFAVDDAHGTEHDVFHGWIVVKSPDLKTESIMSSIKSGAFYSSMGPEIHDIKAEEIEVEGRDGNLEKRTKISVSCSPARSITFKSLRSRGRHVRASGGNLLTEAEYTVSAANKYVRIEITDEAGNKGWSNPFIF